MITIKRLAILVMALIISACATRPQTNVELLPRNIEDVTHWRAAGKILLSENGKKQSGHFYWQQTNDDYQFVVSTFLGIDVFSIKVIDGLATIYIDGKDYQSRQPAQLLQQLTGQTLPLSHISSWLIGMAPTASSHVSQIQTNETNQMRQFTYQDNKTVFNTVAWTIKYQQRVPVYHFELPSLISIDSPQNRIKLKINRWELN